MDQIILNGGNYKQQEDQWVYMHEGGEFLEGTFFNSIDEAKVEIEISEDQKSIKVINTVGDGLYAPHKEIITIIYMDDSWKLGDLQWESLN